MVQRSGGPYSPDRVKVNEKTPKVEGAASWARKGADTIDVNGPEVSLTAPTVIEAATADEWDEMNVGPRIQVGPTQSVTASMRTGVYREGATGPVSGTYNMKAGPSRDAQWDREKNRQVAAVPAPWYSQPTIFNAGLTSANVEFFDRPGFDLPLKKGKGTLAEVKGSDNFITSIAAKPDRGGLDHLVRFSWGVPWDMQIAPDQKSGTGARTDVTPTDQIPPTLDGPIAVQNAATWLAFTSVAQAEAAGAATLLRYLPAAAEHDAAAAATIRLALKNLDPTISVRCHVEDTGNAALKMRLAVVARGTKTHEYGDKLVLDDREAKTASFKLSQLFDIATMASAKIYLTVKKYGRLWGHEGERTFPPADPPYDGATATGRVGGADVTVTFAMP